MNVEYRKYLIISINVIILIWLVKIVFFPKYNTDFFGLFLITIFGFIFLYNVYALLIYKFYTANEQLKAKLEIIFLFLLLLPFLVIWYFTK